MRSSWLGASFFRGGGVQQSPNAFQRMYRLDGDISEERAEEPKASENTDHGAVTGEGRAPEDQPLHQGNDDEQKEDNISQAGTDPERQAAPMRGDAPNGAIPEALREIEQRQEAQADGDAQQQKSPIHSNMAPRLKLQV